MAETLATETSGTEAAGPDTVSDTAVSDTARPDAAVTDTAASDTAGTDGGVDIEGRVGTTRSVRNGPVSEEQLVQEGDVAGDYLERLLDLVDYDGDIDLDVEAGRAMVSIDGGEDLERLVGPRGSVLEALQELTRLAVQQRTGARSRLMLDIAQWRSTRRHELSKLGRSTAERVRDVGEPARLQPMTPFERKIVHDAVAAVDGVRSESEGEEPQRRVVVLRST